MAIKSGQKFTSFPDLLISFAFIDSLIGIGGVGENFLFPSILQLVNMVTDRLFQSSDNQDLFITREYPLSFS